MDEKNVKVIVEGKRRARILEYVSTYPFYQVLAKEIRPAEDAGPETPRILKRVLVLFEEYLKLNQNANLQIHHPRPPRSHPGTDRRHHRLPSVRAPRGETEPAGDDQQPGTSDAA